MSSLFSQIVVQPSGLVKPDAVEVVVGSIDEAKSILFKEKDHVSSHKKPSSEFHDVFGDFICGLAMDLQQYWSQYGIGDKHNTLDFASNMLSAIKRIVQIKPVPVEEEDDSINIEEDYIFIKEPVA